MHGVLGAVQPSADSGDVAHSAPLGRSPQLHIREYLGMKCLCLPVISSAGQKELCASCDQYPGLQRAGLPHRAVRCEREQQCDVAARCALLRSHTMV